MPRTSALDQGGEGWRRRRPWGPGGGAAWVAAVQRTSASGWGGLR